MGGKRFSFSVLSALFAMESLYGCWSIRVWRVLEGMVGENLDISVSFFHPYIVWNKVANWYASASGNADPATAAGFVHAAMWTMVFGGGLCALLFLVLAMRARPVE